MEGNSQSFSGTLSENNLKGRREVRVGAGERYKAYGGYTKIGFSIKNHALDKGMEGEDSGCVQVDAYG